MGQVMLCSGMWRTVSLFNSGLQSARP